MSKGLSLCPDPEKADIVVINTCAYCKDAENSSVRKIKTFQQIHKRHGSGQKKIMVTGCLPGISRKRTEKLPVEILSPPGGYLDFFSSCHDFDRDDFRQLTAKHHILFFIRKWYFGLESLIGKSFHPLHNIVKASAINDSFHILTVSTGCAGKCTFCAIKNSKGNLRSRNQEDIFHEFDDALCRGIKNFWLMADDLGCYGIDKGSSFSELMSGLLSRKKEFSLVLNYLDPGFLIRDSDSLAEILADPRIILVNIPIQSGSDRILSRMGRYPDTAALRNLLKKLKKKNPSLALKTNLLTGFPGERLSDLLETWKIIRYFDVISALPYSPRPGTPSASYPEQISETDKCIRTGITRALITLRHFRVLTDSLCRPSSLPESAFRSRARKKNRKSPEF